MGAGGSRSLSRSGLILYLEGHDTAGELGGRARSDGP